MLACFKIRVVPINVNYRYVDSELAYIFDNADLVACVARNFSRILKLFIKIFYTLKALIHVDDESSIDITDIDSVSYEEALRECSNVRDFPERADDDLLFCIPEVQLGYPKE